ncbi:MAG: hypothetical protein RMI56_04590 [Sulfolobales archaeon]|nr:hypothetical protein [Sulfolobales archaeon]MDW8083062.1 hypothetical protein [Sulfolobales archaeon]
METLADRFFTKVPSYYNLPKEELEIVKKAFAVSDLPVERVTNPQTVLEIVTLLEKLAHLSEVVADCVVRLVTYSGDHEAVLYGPLHRASIHLALLSRACALLNGRDYVMPDDV